MEKCCHEECGAENRVRRLVRSTTFKLAEADEDGRLRDGCARRAYPIVECSVRLASPV